MDFKDDFKMSGNGYRVSRNGVTIIKPDGMSDDYWFGYVAPHVGKSYVKDPTILFGMTEQEVTSGVEEMEEGCSGGACAI